MEGHVSTQIIHKRMSEPPEEGVEGDGHREHLRASKYNIGKVTLGPVGLVAIVAWE